MSAGFFGRFGVFFGVFRGVLIGVFLGLMKTAMFPAAKPFCFTFCFADRGFFGLGVAAASSSEGSSSAFFLLSWASFLLRFSVTINNQTTCTDPWWWMIFKLPLALALADTMWVTGWSGGSGCVFFEIKARPSFVLGWAVQWHYDLVVDPSILIVICLTFFLSVISAMDMERSFFSVVSAAFSSTLPVFSILAGPALFWLPAEREEEEEDGVFSPESCNTAHQNWKTNEYEFCLSTQPHRKSPPGDWGISGLRRRAARSGCADRPRRRTPGWPRPAGPALAGTRCRAVQQRPVVKRLDGFLFWFLLIQAKWSICSDTITCWCVPPDIFHHVNLDCVLVLTDIRKITVFLLETVQRSPRTHARTLKHLKTGFRFAAAWEFFRMFGLKEC